MGARSSVLRRTSDPSEGGGNALRASLASIRAQVAIRWTAAVRRRPVLTDGVVACALTTVGLLAVRTGIDTAPPGHDLPPTTVWVGLTLALILPLALRPVPSSG